MCAFIGYVGGGGEIRFSTINRYTCARSVCRSNREYRYTIVYAAVTDRRRRTETDWRASETSSSRFRSAESAPILCAATGGRSGWWKGRENEERASAAAVCVLSTDRTILVLCCVCMYICVVHVRHILFTIVYERVPNVCVCVFAVHIVSVRCANVYVSSVFKSLRYCI